MKRTLVLSLLTMALASLSHRTSAQGLQLISTVDPAQGPAAGGGGDSWAPILSPDARYVLFASTANNLLLATNGNPIPLHDSSAVSAGILAFPECACQRFMG